MTTFPTSISFGRVVGRFLLAVADGNTTDGTPDPVAAAGTITLSPLATEILATGASPAIVVPADIRCQIDPNGVICGPDGNEGVWVVTGDYTVEPSITNANLASFDITVLPTHTIAAPLDLALAAPMVPTGTQVFVVNQQVYTDTLAARDAAIAAAETAEGFGPSTLTYNPNGSLASVTEGGVLTTYAYNPDGSLNTETRNGQVRTWTYNSAGQPTGSTVTSQ